MRILIYGYGNPGRQDDGLGIQLVSRLESWAIDKGLANVEFECNYQLNIEDADTISQMDLVVFADASEEDIVDFCLSKVDASTKLSFTTHAASPGYIVQLCRELFNKEPLVLLLHIKGYKWDFQEGLSDRAEENLKKALDYIKIFLENSKESLGPIEENRLC
jgi:hydrogenase maturation protease